MFEGVDKGYLALGAGVGTWALASVFPYAATGGTAPIGGGLYAGQVLEASIYMLGGAFTAVLALHADEKWLKYAALVLAFILVANGVLDLLGKGFL